MVSFISFILLTMKLPFGILLQIEWESSVSWKEWNILHKIIVCWFVEWVQNTFVIINWSSSVKLSKVTYYCQAQPNPNLGQTGPSLQLDNNWNPKRLIWGAFDMTCSIFLPKPQHNHNSFWLFKLNFFFDQNVFIPLFSTQNIFDQNFLTI